MGLGNLIMNYGKWKFNGVVVAKVLFYIVPDGSIKAKIMRDGSTDKTFYEVLSFQNDLDFWMLSTYMFSWFAGIAYRYHSYSFSLRQMWEYLVLVLENKNAQIPDEFNIDPTHTKIPYTEFAFSNTEGAHVFSYNMSLNRLSNGTPMELYMFGLTMERLIGIYPHAHQLFNNGFRILLDMAPQGYSLNNFESGKIATHAVSQAVMKQASNGMTTQELENTVANISKPNSKNENK